MTEKRMKLGKLIGKIMNNSNDIESFNTGLVGEHIIVASYQEMSLENLIKMRYIITKLIKKKKEFRRVEENKKVMEKIKGGQS